MFRKIIDRLLGRRDEYPDRILKGEPTVSPVTADAQEKLPEKEGSPHQEEQEEKEPLTDNDSAASPSDTGPSEPIDKEDLKNRIVEAMKTIYDPEIPINVYDIGLIYKIEPQDDGIVQLTMTLTTPNCPAAGILPGEVESKARTVDGVRGVEFELTFDPPWTPDLMSEGARLELGLM